MQDSIKNARILIVDDQEANVLYLETVLCESGYSEFRSTQDSRQVLSLFQESKPDLILLDLMMPHLDGFAVMEQLKPLVAQDSYLPVLAFDRRHQPRNRAPAAVIGRQRFSGQALRPDGGGAAHSQSAFGAYDYLTKPLDVKRVLQILDQALKQGTAA